MHFCRIFATTPEYSRSVLSLGFYIVPFGGILAAAIFQLSAFSFLMADSWWLMAFGSVFCQHSRS